MDYLIRSLLHQTNQQHRQRQLRHHQMIMCLQFPLLLHQIDILHQEWTVGIGTIDHTVTTNTISIRLGFTAITTIKLIIQRTIISNIKIIHPLTTTTRTNIHCRRNFHIRKVDSTHTTRIQRQIISIQANLDSAIVIQASTG